MIAGPGFWHECWGGGGGMGGRAGFNHSKICCKGSMVVSKQSRNFLESKRTLAAKVI